MKPFTRRHFHGPGDMLSSVFDVLSRVNALPALVRGRRVDNAFQQRLWVVVTAVNDCRYCAWVHGRMALVSGITAEEIEALAAGGITDSPPEQRPALLYAQHWAEQEGRADPEAHARLVEAYDPDTVRVIELVLYSIRVSNLTGNTWDLLLYRMSGGRLDVERPFGGR